MLELVKAPPMKKIACFVIVLATIVAVAVARPQQQRTQSQGRNADQRRDPNDLFLEHLTRVQGFVCREAKPRTIALSDLVHDAGEESWTPSTHEVVFPTVTVLHRCEWSSGCCLQGDKFQCRAVETERVPLAFQVSNVVFDEEGVRRLESRIEILYATNHTRCSCIQEPDMPK